MKVFPCFATIRLSLLVTASLVFEQHGFGIVFEDMNLYFKMLVSWTACNTVKISKR